MPHNRFYAPTIDNLVHLSSDESYHLTQVMRHNLGDTVEVFDGKGSLALCKVTKADKRKAELETLSVEKKEKALPEIALYQAYLQPTHLELVIEKGTELGCDIFYLFPAQKSSKKEYSDNQKRRLNTILINSSKQCGRLYLPKIEWLESLLSFDSPTFFGSLKEGSKPLLQALPPSPHKLQYVVGPEPGWTDEEEKKLEGLGALPTSLNLNILRAETASITAISLLSNTRLD